MKQIFTSIFLIVLMSMVGTKAYAYDISVENADGVTIYYNYINDGQDLEVTRYTTNINFNFYDYKGDVVIPEDVTYMSRTRKVISIGAKAFYSCRELTSVNIPNSVTNIGKEAFSYCDNMTSVNIPNGVTSIGEYAFNNCYGLTSVNIPSSLTGIENGVFQGCGGLTSLTIPNSVTSIGEGAFESCTGLISLTIPNSVTIIKSWSFSYCFGLTSLIIPDSVTKIENGAFSGCYGLTSLTIPNSVTSIGSEAFRGCSGLTSITIPNSVTYIGGEAFSGWDIPTVISLIENPFKLDKSIFNNNTFKNATLYVPVGTIDKYKATDGWKEFLFIEEGTGGSEGGGGSTPEKCEKPTINYSNGKLTFTCGTEGATCQYNITDTDVKAGSDNEVQLTVTYNLTVFATKTGYDNSETVTATLCWIDVDPKTEGIENSIANVRANPVLIQSNEGVLNISGIDDGTDVVVYSVSGQMVGATKAKANQASVFTNIKKGEIAIVKIGDKSIKVVMQ